MLSLLVILTGIIEQINGITVIEDRNIDHSIINYNDPKIGKHFKQSSPQQPINDDDDDGGFIILIAIFASFFGITLLFSGLTFVFYVLRRKFTLSEDELIRQEENQVYLELDSEEQELYFQSREYLSSNPYFKNDLTLSQNLLIQEKGINAWEFIKDSMLTNNDLLILNKYELNFFKKFECSTQTNLPIPNKNEVYYFESKIYSLPDAKNTKISIGMGIKPYPWFRLPGRHAHSISYDSDGFRRHNQPFHFTSEAPFPELIEGDVVGVGYRVRSGTIFFTRNGKKLSESKIGGHIKNFKILNNGQLYPIIGANNLCSVHVNLGQMGYVFIEGNVKKWGFAPLEGSGPAPPAYNKFNSDILLERSEVDENDLSEREDDFPPDFWQVNSDKDNFSYNAYDDVNSNDERITLNSLLPVLPPSYDLENEDEELQEPFEEPQQQKQQQGEEQEQDYQLEYPGNDNLENVSEEPQVLNQDAVEIQNEIQNETQTEDENLGNQENLDDDAYSEHFQTVNEISESDLPSDNEH